MNAQPVTRGCGTRKSGGIYMECGLSENGQPIEEFLVDPPTVLSEDMQHALGIKPRGVTLLEQGGAWHVIDWVGAEHYPNVADFVEEARRFGTSRRCEGIDYSKLTPQSRMLLCHPRAWVNNAEPYFKEWVNVTGGARPYRPCPQQKLEHAFAVTLDAAGTKIDQYLNEGVMCAGIWWNDVEGGVLDDVPNTRYVMRSMPAFQYKAATRPADVVPEYALAIFMSLPITRLACVKDASGRSKKKFARATMAQIPVEEVNE